MIETSLGKRVVITLTKNIQGKYHRVLKVMKEFLLNKIYAPEIVLVKIKKWLPKNQIIDKLMKKGDSKGKILTTMYRGSSWKIIV